MSPATAGVVLASATVSGWLGTCSLLPILRRHVIDLPNARSSHSRPTPRGGGLGILIGAAAGLTASAALGIPVPPSAILVAAVAVALIGLLDDRLGGIPAGIRLLVQAAGASFVVWKMGPVPALPLPPPMDVPLGAAASAATVLLIVAVTNIYNFLDGIDGFAGVQGIVAGLAVAAALSDPRARALGLALAGGCAGFLYFNWRPARVFMGDVGACALGFLFACLSLVAPFEERGPSALLIVLALWFFLTDGCYTLVRRLARGEKVWQAHREHLYQRLARTGMRHDQVTLLVGSAGALLATLGAAAVRCALPAATWGVLCLGAVAFAGYVGLVHLREARWRSDSAVVNTITHSAVE